MYDQNKVYCAGDANSICQADLSLTAQLLQGRLSNISKTIKPDQSSKDHPQASKGKKKQVFDKGNYNRYYGYRLGSGEKEDSRLQVIPRTCLVF